MFTGIACGIVWSALWVLWGASESREDRDYSRGLCFDHTYGDLGAWGYRVGHAFHAIKVF